MNEEATDLVLRHLDAFRELGVINGDALDAYCFADAILSDAGVDREPEEDLVPMADHLVARLVHLAVFHLVDWRKIQEQVHV